LLFSVITEILPVIFYLLYSKRINDKSLRVILFLLLANLASDLYGVYSIFSHVNRGQNFVSFNIFILVETLCLYFYFYQILFSRSIRKAILFTGIVFLLYWLFRFIGIGAQVYLYNSATFEYISVLILAIYFYYSQIIKVDAVFIYRQPKFWVISAYLIYIAGTFFLLLYLPTLDVTVRQEYYNILNSLFTIIRTILLSIAMFMKTEHLSRQKFKLT
jgi:hypothetical protein